MGRIETAKSEEKKEESPLPGCLYSMHTTCTTYAQRVRDRLVTIHQVSTVHQQYVNVDDIKDLIQKGADINALEIFFHQSFSLCRIST